MTLPQTWSSRWYNTTLGADSSPNAVEPPTTGGGCPYIISTRSNMTTTQVVLSVDGDAAESVTVATWIFDRAVYPSGKWILWDTAVAVVVGAPRKISVPSGAKVWHQVTAKTGTPDGVYAGEMAG